VVLRNLRSTPVGDARQSAPQTIVECRDSVAEMIATPLVVTIQIRDEFDFLGECIEPGIPGCLGSGIILPLLFARATAVLEELTSIRRPLEQGIHHQR
jgi:hypothetical protein